MKERPILFKGAMVRAILAGTKTQTRRLVKPQLAMHDFVIGGIHPAFMPPEIIDGFLAIGLPTMLLDKFAYLKRLPYGKAGDRLWVKETFYPAPSGYAIAYRADCDVMVAAGVPKWKPSIFMSRFYSRITLEIVNVRVERLNDISEADAIAEGVEAILDNSPFGHPPAWRDYMDPDSLPFDSDKPAASYRSLWESINGAGSWAANPWVWVIEFRRITQ